MLNELILIVEDNESHRTLLSELLTLKGFNCIAVSSAEDALVEVSKNHPRMILLDLQLPKMSGLDFARNLKADAKNSNIIIIAVTAYAMKFEKEAALGAGCDDYVTKPIDTIALPLLIRKHLDAKKLFDSK